MHDSIGDNIVENDSTVLSNAAVKPRIIPKNIMKYV